MVEWLRDLAVRAGARSSVGTPGPVALGMIGSGGVLLVAGLRARSPATVPLALAGVALVYRGATGAGPFDGLLERTPAARGVTRRAGRDGIVRAATINRAREEVYAVWQSMAGTPGATLGPAADLLRGDVEVLEERPAELVRWRVLRDRGGHEIEMRLADAPAERGTEVRVLLRVDSPASLADRLLRAAPAIREQQLAELVRRFKRLGEAGEVPTTRGQPSGRRSRLPRPASVAG